MAPSTIYLVSGANKGLGFGLVSQILIKHENAFVYAGCRKSNEAAALQQLHVKYLNRLVIVRLVSADVEGNTAVAKLIENKHGRVDTVIANAGMFTTFGTVAEVPPKALDEHFHVNVTGTITLFQAVYSLLKMSAEPRFIPISSSGGRFDGPVMKAAFGNLVYGASKAALNWATRKIHFENEWLITFPMCPGGIDTDMLKDTVANDINGVIKGFLAGQTVPKPEAVAAALITLIDSSTREKEGGEFIFITGERLDW